MIDLSTEAVLSLAEAAKLLPSARLGRPVSFACILRWILNGTKSPDGRIVKLEALRLGSRWVTSREALQRFAERLTPPMESEPTATPRTPGHRRRVLERTARDLEKLGI
jgi:hypothetical protein